MDNNTNTTNQVDRWQPVGLDPETYKRLSAIATENGRSLVGQIRYWIAKEQMYGSVAELSAALPKPKE